MPSEALSTDSSALPPRAGVAVLTLQLRATLQEAITAEAAAEASERTARDELRVRLDALIAERSRHLDAIVAEARADAAETVDAARRAAAVMIAMAARPAVDAPAMINGVPAAHVHSHDQDLDLDHHTVPPAPTSPWQAPSVEAPPSEHPMDAAPPIVEIALVDRALDREAPVDVPVPTATPVPLVITPNEMVPVSIDEPIAPSPPIDRVPPTSNVVIDADAFATVFATVVATLLEERLAGVGHTTVAGPVAAPVPAKQSFWAHARHPDVILLGLTTAIVLVVLAAWLA